MALDSPLHLRQTEAFIDERPVEITITRRKRVKTETGGFRFTDPSALASQRMRKVAPRGDLLPMTTSDGQVVVPTATMVGLPDVDIQKNDKFILDGVVHEVLSVSRLPEWRVSAEVYEQHG